MLHIIRIKQELYILTNFLHIFLNKICKHIYMYVFTVACKIPLTENRFLSKKTELNKGNTSLIWTYVHNESRYKLFNMNHRYKQSKYILIQTLPHWLHRQSRDDNHLGSRCEHNWNTSVPLRWGDLEKILRGTMIMIIDEVVK